MTKIFAPSLPASSHLSPPVFFSSRTALCYRWIHTRTVLYFSRGVIERMSWWNFPARECADCWWWKIFRLCARAHFSSASASLSLSHSPRFILFFFFYPSRPLFITLLVNFYYYTFHSGKPGANSIYSAPSSLSAVHAIFSRLARTPEEMQMGDFNLHSNYAG